MVLLRDQRDAKAGAHGGAATKLEVAELCIEAKAAMKQMGWPPSVVQAAVRAAAAALGDNATLERVLIEALRRCPRPVATTAPTRALREAR
jgi:hypothetical protein